MRYRSVKTLLASTLLVGSGAVWAGQVPYSSTAPDIPISSHDRVYAAEQFSNTVSVTDPSNNKLLGVIQLGDPQPHNLSPLYHGQVLVHGMGFSPDHQTLAVVATGSNSVSFIDTETNRVKHVTYLGRSPHEAFFTPDGTEVWITIRGEDYIEVLDGKTYEEKTRIPVAQGPGMQIFSPDGKYGYVCTSFNPVTQIISVASHKIVGRVKQASAFCPDIAATPDGKQVWFTLKDIGKVQVFNAKPPFNILKTIDAGPITNHVNIAHNSKGTFAYVTIGGTGQVKVYRTDNFEQIATVPVGSLPHGLWPSGDGKRIYVGLENEDKIAVIDTLKNTKIAEIPIGHAPQALVYVPNAVPHGKGTQNLVPLGISGQTTQFKLASVGSQADAPNPSSVTLFDQGLSQILEASITGLKAGESYVLALASKADGKGQLEPLSEFKANPAGAAIVNAVGPIRQVVRGESGTSKRYLVIASGTMDKMGKPIQIQAFTD